jgi:SCO1/SenC
VFITVDPERDTSDALKAYARKFANEPKDSLIGAASSPWVRRRAGSCCAKERVQYMAGEIKRKVFCSWLIAAKSPLSRASASFSSVVFASVT